MLFNFIFFRIFVVMASENDSKIDVFSYFFQKRRFCKNRAPVEAKLIFFRFRASKNRRKIDTKTHSKKTTKKTSKKSVLASIFASQTLPKSSENPPKSLRKATLSEACFATLCKPPRNRRKSTGAIACKASIWLRI